MSRYFVVSYVNFVRPDVLLGYRNIRTKFEQIRQSPNCSEQTSNCYLSITMSWRLKDIILLFVMGTSAADNVKQLDYTSYLGYDQGDGVSFWKGIRFAAAPVGELRFAGPQDPPATKDIQDATAVCWSPITLTLSRFYFVELMYEIARADLHCNRQLSYSGWSVRGLSILGRICTNQSIKPSRFCLDTGWGV